jgi:hypothetical protein
VKEAGEYTQHDHGTDELPEAQGDMEGFRNDAHGNFLMGLMQLAAVLVEFEA